MSGPRYVCIHGHFYQPPRESPWLERIEQQESAWPAHDWNDRVTRECYAPNSHARTLARDGRIVRISNNYAWMSFNFGPTLLSWMEHERPDVYEAILEADREGAARFDGHGPALAQVYNHAILPLADRRDKLTQVRWGLRDFQLRFGRSAEGMWLAETAVDVESLEVLAAHGVRFTILAPHQCARVRPPGGQWVDVRGQRVDPRRPYLARLPSGLSIAIFFYDGPISRAVAFERLLDDGYRFAERLLGAFDPSRTEPQLVHIATDGETYGHHHAYGEMALAVALRRITEQPGVKLVDYGQMLALHPPAWECEIVDKTSWSCAHGVERWRSNCGCNSGTSWQQAWRAPLRSALDWLKGELDPRYESAVVELLRDPWLARDAYIDVVLDREDESVARFLSDHAKGEPTPSERQRILSLLELQRHALLMYTSCGWFFDDIAGIETVQVVQYAARAIQLANELFGVDLEPAFVERLGKAPANRPEHADGGRVYELFVRPAMVDLPKIGAHLAISSLFDGDADRSSLGGYEGEIIERALQRAGAARLSCGNLRVRSRITTAAAHLSFAVLHFGDHNLLGGIRAFDGVAEHVAIESALEQVFARADLTEAVRLIERFFEGRTFSLRTLFRDEQRRILDLLVAHRTRAAEAAYEEIYEDAAPLLRFVESLGQQPPPVFRAAARYTLDTRLRRELGRGRELDLRQITALVEEAQQANVALDPVGLGVAAQQMIEGLVAELEGEPEDLDLLERAASVAEHFTDSAWKMDLGEAQNRAYGFVRRYGAEWGARSMEDDPRVRLRLRALQRLAGALRIAAEP